MPPQDHLDDLTAREREVLDLVRLGLTNEEIAGRLGITEAGIKYHVSQILSKLGVTTREEAAALRTASSTSNVAEAFEPRWGRRWWRVFWPGVPMMLIGALITILATAAMIRGVSDDQDLGAATSEFSGPTPVPWVDSTPAPNAATADPGQIRLCTAGDLASAYAGENAETGGRFISTYGIGNRAEDPCRLGGPPEVRLVGAGGIELPTSVSYSPSCPPAYLESCIESRPVIVPGESGEVEFRALKPGQAAMTLVWSPSDGASSCGSPRVFKIRFVLPSGDSVDVKVPDPIPMAPCNGHIYVRDFRQVGTPRQRP